MKQHNIRLAWKRNEAGIATLIAIFILLLISAVGLALVASSTSETSLAANYRGSTSAYYAGLAGLEEARGRMVGSNPNTFAAGFIPSPMAVGQVRYILNPVPGEVVAPTNLTSAATYPDNEYNAEFGVPITSATVQTTASVSTVAGIQGPLYKWVRINPITEKSIGVDENGDGVLDNTQPLYYDSAHVTGSGTPMPSLIYTLAPPSTANEAYEISTLAVMPDGSERLLQYVIAPTTFGLNFGSPLTLAGPGVAFQPANSNQYYVNGQDGSGSAPVVSGCSTNPSTSLPAIGVTTSANVTSVSGSISRTTHYTGGGLSAPSVSNVSSSNPLLDTPSGLSQVVNEVEQNADLVVNGNATQSTLSATGMSATNPKTVVVDGDFTMSGNFTGYGLLVVTGNFSYSGDDGWDGIILVVGKGTTIFTGSGGGNNEFDGALFAATIYDANGNLLPSLGNVNFNINGGGGNGVYYNSCWVKKVQQPPSFKVLAYHEKPYHD